MTPRKGGASWPGRWVESPRPGFRYSQAPPGTPRASANTTCRISMRFARPGLVRARREKAGLGRA
jgi:hypothetical protein